MIGYPHFATCRMSIPCTQCPRTFANAKGLRRHKCSRAFDTIETQLKCACEYIARSEPQMRYHVEKECHITLLQAANCGDILATCVSEQENSLSTKFLNMGTSDISGETATREIGPLAEFEISFAASMMERHISHSSAENILTLLKTQSLTSEVMSRVPSYQKILEHVMTPGYFFEEPFKAAVKNVYEIKIPNPSYHLVGDEPCETIELQYGDVVDLLVNSVFDNRVLSKCPQGKPLFTVSAAVRTINGERVYEHLSDGTWWATAEEKAVLGGCEDSTRRVFPLSLYLDETKVAAVTNQQAKPLFAVAGILSPECRGATDAWVLIGFVPTLRPAPRVGDDAKFLEFKAWFYRKCLDVMVGAPLREYNQAGGFWLNLPRPPGQPPLPRLLFFPHVSNIIQDKPEGYALCGQRMGGKCMLPCKHCYITRALTGTVGTEALAHVNGPVRTAKANDDMRKSIEKNFAHKEVKKKENLKAHSLTQGVRGACDMPFGGEGYGVNGAVPADMMHQYLLGIMKRTWEGVVKMVPGTEKEKLAGRFQFFNTRHADPLMPDKKFNNIFKAVSSLTAKEYPPLLWQLLVILADEPVYLTLDRHGRDRHVEVVTLLHEVLMVREVLWKEVHYEKELVKIQDLICRMLQRFKDVFSEEGEDCTFPKFHATLHYTQCIERFGSLRLLDSGVGERQHKDQVKTAYRLTSRLAGASMLKDMSNAAHLRRRIFALNEEVKLRRKQKKRSAEALEEPEPSQERLRTPKPVGERVEPQAASGTGNFLSVHVGIPKDVIRQNRVEDVNEEFQSRVELLCANSQYRSYEAAVQARGLKFYKSASLSIPGAKSNLILRAHPNFRHKEWYDFVKVSVGAKSYAARVLSFLTLGCTCYAFVENYVSAVKATNGVLVGAGGKLGSRSAAPSDHGDDLSLRHHAAGLPFIKLAGYGIIELSAITGGLWAVRSHGKRTGHCWWVLHFSDDILYQPPEPVAAAPGGEPNA